MANNPNPTTKIKPVKKGIFYFIAIIIPVMLLVLFETGLRLGGYGYNLTLFVKSENYPGYKEINPVVAKRYFLKFKGTQVSNDIFLINKPDTAYRVFVMGCSTTRGFPYEMGLTFSRILYYRLQDAFPHKRIEVVNTSMAAVNSITQLDFIEEILKQNPDAILIYTGHNEYYGALGVGSVESAGSSMWLKRLHLKLMHLRLYQWVQNSITKFVKSIASDGQQPSRTLMERMAKDKAIAYGSDTYKRGIEQFEVNMEQLVEKAKKAGVPVIFSNIVSNIRDNKPFKSVETEGYPQALEAFNNAVAFEKNDDFENARKQYYLAKDLDAIRFRAAEDINQTIEKIASKNGSVLLNMKDIFEIASPNRLIGNNLMTEHLHPNVEGYFLMADAFFNCMKNNAFITKNWDSLLIKPAAHYRNNWGFTALDSLAAHIKIESLKAGWPFQPETVINQYIYQYRPASFVDSLAIKCVLHNNVHIEDMHRELAAYYATQREYKMAFLEIYALIKSYPFLSELYVEAAKYLAYYENYQAVISFLKTCPDFSTDYYINYRIGKIYEANGNDSVAAQYFNMALEFAPKGEKLEMIYADLYKIFKKMGNTAKANEMLKKIRLTNPYFKEDNKKEFNVVAVDNKVKTLIKQGIELARNSQFDKSLEVLFESVKIKENALAYRIIGSIYIQQKNPKATEYFEKSYKLEPLNENTLHNLFLLSIEAKNIVKANKYLDEFRMVSNDPERNRNFENILLKASQNQK